MFSFFRCLAEIGIVATKKNFPPNGYALLRLVSHILVLAASLYGY